MKAVPFKVEKSDKAWWFDRYFFSLHRLRCRIFLYKCDSRTNPYCCDCKRKHDKERAKEREQRKTKQIRAKAFDELTQAFRAEFQQMMDLEIDDCINWADWLDAIAEQMKGGAV